MPNKLSQQYEFIQDDESLIAISDTLKSANWIAVDTEFFRVNTYYPELCLLQIANPECAVIIDPYSISSLDPVYNLLFDRRITKVFHSARQDLELFYHDTGKVPGPIYDTQIAATMLGFDDQIGYANLVKQMLGVELSKSQTRTNWKRRPLTDKQLEYAIDDVTYLAEIYQKLSIDTVKKNMSIDVTDANTKLENPFLYQPDPETLWKKIKLSKKLDNQQQHRLMKLVAWRENTARTKNRPRKWIISDHALVKISRLNPETLEALKNINTDNDVNYDKFANDILDVIQGL